MTTRDLGRAARWALLAAGVALATGCASVGQVQPWEKGLLTKPGMSFGNDPLGDRFAEHMYASKENSSGGSGVGGGGCGCN
ncbi:hypothetical protein IP84_09850 [beta proteobacterium AAP99]|nr:hypothetical protein IP84_09850 [beta proteobacterium AAP99]